MVCGVHLRILLIFLVQAEHACCLWATQAQSSQRQNSNGYVGYSQQESGLRRLGGSNPQNQLRQASVSPGSAQKSSINAQAAVSSVYSQGPSSSGFSQTSSQPSESGYSSVRFVQRSSVPKPNWQTENSKKVIEPKRHVFGLSTAIASGSSVSKYKKQSALTDTSKRTARPVQQGTQGTSKYLSSSSASLQSPSSKSPSQLASYQSVPQNAPSSGAGQFSYGQGGYAAAQTSSSLLSPASQGNPVGMQTSATAPAKRVSRRHKTKTSYPSSSSTLNKYFPRQTEAANPYQSNSVAGGHAQGSYKPTSLSSKQNTAASFQPRSLQASWNSRSPDQGAHNPPASGSGNGQRYAPTNTHHIPQRFGGFAIRRLKSPEEQKKVAFSPQLTNTAPSAQTVNYKPQVQSIGKPQQTYTASSAQTVNYKPQVQSIGKPQQTYTASSAQTVNYKPQVQSIRKPQQTYTASSAQTVNYKPQVQSIRKPQQTYTASSAHIVSYKPQVQSIVKQEQTYDAPSAQTVSYKPQFQSIRKPQQAQTAQSAQVISYKPQQSLSAPSGQTVLYKPQVQSVRKPDQTYTASSAHTVSYKPQDQSDWKPEQAHAAPSAQVVSYKPQQSFAAPSAESVSYEPQVQSVHQESKWKRVRPYQRH